MLERDDPPGRIVLLAAVAAGGGFVAGLVTGALIGPGTLAALVGAFVAMLVGAFIGALGRPWVGRRGARERSEPGAPTSVVHASPQRSALVPPAIAALPPEVPVPSLPPAPPDPVGASESDRAASGRPSPALVSAGLMPSLRQVALAFEKAAEIVQIPELRPLLSIGHNAALRAQEGVGRLCSHERGAALDPFPIREDIALGVRALSFEVGRDVALRFAGRFPAHVIADRSALRMALVTAFHATLARGTDAAEILVEASHDDSEPLRHRVRIAVSVQGDDTIGALPLLGADAEDSLKALAALLAPEDGRLFARADGRQVAVTLPVGRYKRLTGTTLYGLGALAEHTALVIDPRPIGRVTICELLASWRLTPTGVADMDDALAAAERALSAEQRFDVVVLSGFGEEQPAHLLELAANMRLLSYAKVISLESLETLCAPIAPALDRHAGMELKRLARPPSPTELIETLTALLVRPRVERPERTPDADGLSLLVAEDNPVNQALLVKLLERRGHAVTVANNGADLVDRLQEAPLGAFDAILMDIQMPVMDGFEATGVIRLREAQDQRARIPIIAVTAHAMGGERERCLEAGMDGYLPKPIVDRELGAALTAVLAGGRTRSSAEATPPEAELFDRQRVLEFAGGDVEFLKNLVDLFAESAPRQLAEIARALAASDAQAVYRGAHQLKGSIGNFGAAAAQRLALALEGAAQRGALDEGRALVTELGVAVETLSGALAALADEAAQVGAAGP